jgi:exopolyphosphatase/guanosine-5'-triphosphate,3'-diphosphate pyrophosphatase
VDLGSNSFHMVVARLEHGRLSILDRIREMVRLGAGLDARGGLSAEAAERALACLGRFSERLKSLHADRVRAVGTNTLRRTRDRQNFLTRASDALGHSIDVISGVEEARLVYLGAASSLPTEAGHRLVVDIGGGSTELIIGSGHVAERLESLYMGCVSMSNVFFPDGRVSRKRFRQARLAARQEVEPVAQSFRGAGWERAYGTSGTIRATGRLLANEDNPSGVITRAGLKDLESRLVDCGDLNVSRPSGLSEERAPVYAGGLAILRGVFDALGIESMMVAEGALREGLLHDLLGRLTDEDARERSVRSLQERFHVDADQAERVRAMAMDLLDQVAEAWLLDGELPRLLLGWSARLHEIGLDIAHAQHHRHAAYLLRHADLGGFSTGEQLLLSALVGTHRRKFRTEFVDALPADWMDKATRLAVILRLAVLLCRSRSTAALPRIACTADERTLRLMFPVGWLKEHPLTMADLEQEARYLDAIDIDLKSV